MVSILGLPIPHYHNRCAYLTHTPPLSPQLSRWMCNLNVSEAYTWYFCGWIWIHMSRSSISGSSAYFLREKKWGETSAQNFSRTERRIDGSLCYLLSFRMWEVPRGRRNASACNKSWGNGSQESRPGFFNQNSKIKCVMAASSHSDCRFSLQGLLHAGP